MSVLVVNIVNEGNNAYACQIDGQSIALTKQSDNHYLVDSTQALTSLNNIVDSVFPSFPKFDDALRIASLERSVQRTGKYRASIHLLLTAA